MASPWRYHDEATALRGMASAGLAVKAIEPSGEEAFIAATKAILTPFIRTAGSVGFGARFQYLVATP